MDRADLARHVARAANAQRACERQLRTALTLRGLAADTALWEIIDGYAWATAVHQVAEHRTATGCTCGLPDTPA
jgi:hypothetical protein